jgi:TolB-like protein
LVRKHLEEMMTSHVFAVSKRAQDLLRLIVEHALAGENESLRERMIGVEMFNRPIDYDTANDSVVRVKATELRKRLTQYYLESPARSAVRIEVPPGSYVPRFVFDPPAPHAQAEPEALRALSPETESRETDRPVPLATVNPEYVPPSERKGRMLLAIAAGLCLIGLSAYFGWRSWSNRSSILSIAVLPFENLSGDARQDYLADGMTEVLIADLGQIDSLRVISRTSAMSFRGTRKALPEIARELSVGSVVEGSVLRDGANVRLTVRLIDAKSDHPIWSKDFINSSSNLLSSEGELAQSIANELSLTISPQTQAHLTRAPSVEMSAEDLYLQGMVAFDSENFGDAMGDFRKAIEMDPNFANPYAALASCYGQMGIHGRMPYPEAFSNQKSNALRAIELDQSLSEAHAELADAAIDESKIAVKLDPLSVTAQNDLAYICSRQYRLELERRRKGISPGAGSQPELGNCA